MAYRRRGFTPKRPMRNAFGGALGMGAALAAKSPLSGEFGKSVRGKPGTSKASSAAKPGLGAPGATPAKPAEPTKPKAPAFDSIYNRDIDTATRKGEARLESLDSQESAVKRDFGIDDPTSPFSRAEGLKRAFLAKYKGVSAGLAARGHLYSGQHERALARTRLEEEQARADLRSAYEQAIGTIGAERAGVKFTTEEEQNQAFEDWLARVPESEAPAPAPAPAPAARKAPAAAGPAKPPVDVPTSKQVQSIAKVTPPPPGTGRGSGNPNASFPKPVTGPDRPKSSVEKRLRDQLREARRKGQAKRVKRLQKRLRGVKRDQNFTRG